MRVIFLGVWGRGFMKDRKLDTWLSKDFKTEQPFLEQLSADLRNAIIENCEFREYEAGQIILRRGDLAERFFILQGGEVLECGKKVSGKYTEQDPVEQGHCFGESSILANTPINHAHIANGPVTLLTMERKAFITFLIQNPGVLVVLYRLQSAKLLKREGRMEALLRPGVQGDLATESFMEIVQLFLNSGKTGIVTLTSEGQTAKIGFNTGQIQYAECGELMGLEVLDEVVGWEEGKFSYEQVDTIAESNIQGDTMSILLDALRKMDEMESVDEEPLVFNGLDDSF
jgi:CRP-like cAMP-binding protein